MTFAITPVQRRHPKPISVTGAIFGWAKRRLLAHLDAPLRPW